MRKYNACKEKQQYSVEIDYGKPKVSTTDYYKFRVFAVFEEGNVGLSGIDPIGDRLVSLTTLIYP